MSTARVERNGNDGKSAIDPVNQVTVWAHDVDRSVPALGTLSRAFAWPGSLLLLPDAASPAPATFCNAAKLPFATAVFAMKLRRVNSLIIISPEGSEFVFWI